MGGNCSYAPFDLRSCFIAWRMCHIRATWVSIEGRGVVASIVLVAAMMIIQAPLSDSVAIAMISGLAVETLGIVAIIAHSLFPNQGD